MAPRRWRRKLNTWQSRLDHAEWLAEHMRLPKWQLVLIPIFVVLTTTIGMIGWNTQYADFLYISTKIFPVISTQSAWIMTNSLSITFIFIIAPFQIYFFPDKTKAFYIPYIILILFIFAVSAYQDYRINKALAEGRWVYCKQATRLYAVRGFAVYAQRPEWCPRSEEEMP